MVILKQVAGSKVFWDTFIGLAPVRSKHIIQNMSQLHLKTMETVNGCHWPTLMTSLWDFFNGEELNPFFLSIPHKRSVSLSRAVPQGVVEWCETLAMLSLSCDRPQAKMSWPRAVETLMEISRLMATCGGK